MTDWVWYLYQLRDLVHQLDRCTRNSESDIAVRLLGGAGFTLRQQDLALELPGGVLCPTAIENQLGHQFADPHRQELVPPPTRPSPVQPNPIPPKPAIWGMLGEVSLLRAVSEDVFPMPHRSWMCDMGALQRPKIPTQQLPLTMPIPGRFESSVQVGLRVLPQTTREMIC